MYEHETLTPIKPKSFFLFRRDDGEMLIEF